MEAKIHLEQIKVNTTIGAHAIEQTRPQPLILDVSFTLNIQKAASTDRIEDTVNYSEMTKYIIEETQKTSFHLLESLASFLAQKILEKFPLINVHLKINKPLATKGLANISIEHFLSA